MFSSASLLTLSLYSVLISLPSSKTMEFVLSSSTVSILIVLSSDIYTSNILIQKWFVTGWCGFKGLSTGVGGLYCIPCTFIMCFCNWTSASNPWEHTPYGLVFAGVNLHEFFQTSLVTEKFFTLFTAVPFT